MQKIFKFSKCLTRPASRHHEWARRASQKQSSLHGKWNVCNALQKKHTVNGWHADDCGIYWILNFLSHSFYLCALRLCVHSPHNSLHFIMLKNASVLLGDRPTSHSSTAQFRNFPTAANPNFVCYFVSDIEHISRAQSSPRFSLQGWNMVFDHSKDIKISGQIYFAKLN